MYNSETSKNKNSKTNINKKLCKHCDNGFVKCQPIKCKTCNGYINGCSIINCKAGYIQHFYKECSKCF